VQRFGGNRKSCNRFSTTAQRIPRATAWACPGASHRSMEAQRGPTLARSCRPSSKRTKALGSIQAVGAFRSASTLQTRVGFSTGSSRSTPFASSTSVMRAMVVALPGAVRHPAPSSRTRVETWTLASAASWRGGVGEVLVDACGGEGWPSFRRWGRQVGISLKVSNSDQTATL
jgi:hypothetical protein